MIQYPICRSLHDKFNMLTSLLPLEYTVRIEILTKNWHERAKITVKALCSLFRGIAAYSNKDSNGRSNLQFYVCTCMHACYRYCMQCRSARGRARGGERFFYPCLAPGPYSEGFGEERRNQFQCTRGASASAPPPVQILGREYHSEQ